MSLLRWVSPRTMEETVTPPRAFEHPFMAEKQASLEGLKSEAPPGVLVEALLVSPRPAPDRHFLFTK
jgi:hypothetical protein